MLFRWFLFIGENISESYVLREVRRGLGEGIFLREVTLPPPKRMSPQGVVLENNRGKRGLKKKGIPLYMVYEAVEGVKRA